MYVMQYVCVVWRGAAASSLLASRLETTSLFSRFCGVYSGEILNEGLFVRKPVTRLSNRKIGTSSEKTKHAFFYCKTRGLLRPAALILFVSVICFVEKALEPFGIFDLRSTRQSSGRSLSIVFGPQDISTKPNKDILTLVVLSTVYEQRERLPPSAGRNMYYSTAVCCVNAVRLLACICITRTLHRSNTQ